MEVKFKIEVKILRINSVICILDRNIVLFFYLINFYMVLFNNDYFRDNIIEVLNIKSYF